MSKLWRFQLAHHEYFEYDRCLRLPVTEVGLFICARCSGIYFGIALAGVAMVLQIQTESWIILVLPIPAFVDWGLDMLWKLNATTNFSRTGSGLLLGVWAVGLLQLAIGGEILFSVLNVLGWMGVWRVVLKITSYRGAPDQQWNSSALPKP